jgi:ribosomal protein S18 acetylase RimI-like enzyme
VEITQCTKADFDQILRDIVDFWGSDRTLPLHHPFLIHEFGDTAFVMKEDGTVVAYLFGFFSPTEPVAYVHLIGVRRSRQREGLGSHLYAHFMNLARARKCTAMKAVTTPDNAQSIAFHRRLGMQLLGEPNERGIPVVRDYRGPGEDRVVFHAPL